MLNTSCSIALYILILAVHVEISEHFLKYIVFFHFRNHVISWAMESTVKFCYYNFLIPEHKHCGV